MFMYIIHRMIREKIRSTNPTIVAMAGILIVAALAIIGNNLWNRPPDMLRTADAVDLRRNRQELRPTDRMPKVEKEAAEAKVMELHRGVTIREAVLAELDQSALAIVPQKSLVWVFSIEPAGGLHYISGGPAPRIPPDATPNADGGFVTPPEGCKPASEADVSFGVHRRGER